MKNFKIFAIVLVALTACNYKDAPPTKFVVKEVIIRGSMSNMAHYKIVGVEGSGLSPLCGYITDSVGKFTVGDMLELNHVEVK